MNDLLNNTNQGHSQKMIKHFVIKINKYTTFNPTLEAIRGKDDKTCEKVTRWREILKSS